ncbi:MAG: cyclodeaminase/cyclohydrolase family protein [Ardenticatenaceae bacterium]
MIDIRSQTIGDFLSELAAGSAAPAAGAGAALTGAMAAGLMSMVSNLTLGRKKYANVHKEIRPIRERTEAIREEMTNLAQLDAHVFERVMAAYRMPRKTETQQSVRTAAIQNTLMDATQVPLKIAVQASELLDYAPTLSKKGNRNAIGDLAVGVLLAEAAMRSALVSVEMNLRLLKDEAFKEGVRQRVEQLLLGRDQLKAQIMAQVS